MEFSIILACCENGGIGLNNKLPWYIPQDLKHFKNVTTSAKDGYKNAVIMGRKTWESLPKCFCPLPDRLNIIISSTIQHDFSNNYLVYTSLNEALEAIQNITYIDKVFVIGGAQLYQDALLHPLCKKAYITHILQQCECDTFIDFQTFVNQFTLIREGNINLHNNIPYTFNEYVNR
jgi:dihydrofolate reductase